MYFLHLVSAMYPPPTSPPPHVYCKTQKRQKFTIYELLLGRLRVSRRRAVVELKTGIFARDASLHFPLSLERALAIVRFSHLSFTRFVFVNFCNILGGETLSRQ